MSTPSATRDLKLLTEAGLIIAEGEKRGRTYRAAPRLQELTARFRIQPPIPELF